jgi:acetyl esterase
MYVPPGACKGLIVYLHGGGWVLGSVESFHPLTATLAQRSGCAVLSVDYRLAPEHRFPLPLDDARVALEWASQEGMKKAGTTGLPLIVMGDSAGANLATTAARIHNQAGAMPPVQLQILAYPVTDCDFDRPSYHAFAEGHLLTRRDMMWFWDQYLPDVPHRADPLASPLRCEDMSASPRALVLTAEFDPLRDEGELYCSRLQASGVAAEHVRCPGLVHGFLAMMNMAPSASNAFGIILKTVEHATV